MSATNSTLTVLGSLLAASGGSLSYAPTQVVNTTPVAQSYDLALTAIPALVTLPAGTVMFGVQMPFDNTIAVSHKWATGDTGGKIHLSYGIPAMCVDSGNLTFYLWSASNVTVTLWSM